ncbi:MAG: aminotransferase class V-fold PLP-dependent enzyme [Firmicutes bacterium]|nr:aminotransferase class V-fold PLP-dependent enzyme [Bacillota bacterium]
MKDIIYFDNSATTYPKPEIVYNYMDEFYRKFGINANRGKYSKSNHVRDIIDSTRKLLKELFNCPKDKEVVFTSSATEAINIILQGINWSSINNVYLTRFEHNAILRTLNHLKKKYNININYLECDKESLTYNLEKIRYQFDEINPDLVIMTHASNVCGNITPIKEISSIAKKYNSKTMVDGAQTSGLLDINLKKTDIDYLVFAGHKTLYGPFGISGFVVNNDSNIRPLMFGGTGYDSANIELPESIPQKFEVGSKNTLAIAGLYASLKWINKVGREEILKSEKKLTKLLLECLEDFDNIKVFKTKDLENQLGVVSCVFNNIASNTVGQVLDKNNIAVRTGLHCAPEAHKFINTFPGGTVRFSLSYFNNEDQISKIYDVLEEIYFS